MKYCRKCGAMMSDDSMFCSGCGARFSDETLPDASAEAAQSPVQPINPEGTQSTATDWKTSVADFVQEFSLSLLFFWIKGRVGINRREVQVRIANTILFIPAGKKEENIPLRNISAAALNTGFNIKSIIIGIICVLGGFAELQSSVVGALVWCLIGLLLIVNGIETKLIIQRAGADFVINVPFYEKNKMQSVQAAIQQALYYEADKTDMNYHAGNIGKAVGQQLGAVIDAMNAKPVDGSDK